MNRPVYLAARRIEQARELAIDLAQKIAVSINPVQLSAEGLERLPEVDLIINTTPAGMWPHVDAMPWPEELPVSAGTVLDMIYNPPVTRFMREALKSGSKVVNGLDMLVEQAALSLEIWTGCSVSREVMKTAALAELENRNFNAPQLHKF
jgi:shikimate dehydrogenase